MPLREPEITFGTAAPATGFFRAGHIHVNTSPATADTKYWLCTASGEPGTWTAFDGGPVYPTSVISTGAITSSSASAGIGYATGAGGAVTQATSKATGVTLNAVTGRITLNGAALAADTTVSFTLTNTSIAATDVVLVTHESAGTLGAYTFASTAAAGSAVIAVHNTTPGILTEAPVLRFVVIKSVVA